MFRITENFEVDRSVFKFEYFHYAAPPLNDVDTPNSQISIDFPRENTALF